MLDALILKDNNNKLYLNMSISETNSTCNFPNTLIKIIDDCLIIKKIVCQRLTTKNSYMTLSFEPPH